ncbi:hypothetical protein [Halorubrum sp. DTA98]|uniref:hypothetical protein n=1 Tax=Halorubrum sp. DTA98 TaxID=3402163 RepID=UPI003AAB3C17
MRRRTLLAAAPSVSTVSICALAGCTRPPWRDGVAAESIAEVTFREGFSPSHDDAFALGHEERPPVETVHEVVDLTDESPPRILICGRIVGQHPSCFEVTLRRAEVIDDVLEVVVVGRVTEEPCADVAVAHPFEVVFTFDSPEDAPSAVELVGFDE